ncbi:MAG: hypothetical protein AAF387_07755 [Pseudomonadota bacterium]
MARPGLSIPSIESSPLSLGWLERALVSPEEWRSIVSGTTNKPAFQRYVDSIQSNHDALPPAAAVEKITSTI